MAQSGYTPILIYGSGTATNVPLSANMTSSASGAELALNYADGKLYFKNSSGVVTLLAGSGGGPAGGSNTQVQYNSSGSLAGSANLTFNGTTLTTANDASISGLTVGKGGGNQGQNTALGNGALQTNTAGNYCVAVGLNSLYSQNGSGNLLNVAVGASAMYSNTSGYYNTGIGGSALYSNTTATSNTAIGYQSLQANTTASNNTAVGYQAGYSNTQANQTFIGYQAGYSTTTGDSNVGLGYQTLYSNTTGVNNVAVGYRTGYGLTTGSSNTFVGGRSINNGNICGFAMTTGIANTILGNFTGNNSGLDIRTASNYIVLSDGDGNPRGIFNGSGQFIVGGTAPTGAGFQSIVFNGNTYNGLAINDSASASSIGLVYFQSGGVTKGSITYNGSVVAYNVTSDQRLKTNIVDAPESNIDEIKIRSFDYISNNSHQEYGVIAQELEQVASYAVYTPKDPEDMMAVDYSKLVPMMIKEIQSLRKRVALLESK